MYIFIILYNVGFSINKAVILVFYQIHIANSENELNYSN